MRRLRHRRARPEPGGTSHLWGRVPEHEDDGHTGPAQVTVGQTVHDVEVALAGHLEPLDGRYHWYGRIAQHDELDAAKRAGATTVRLAVPGRDAVEGRLAEHDAWGNLRVTGLGAPPFELTSVEITPAGS